MRIKLNVLTANVVGKRLIVVEDSIVRGTTTRQIISLLREAGATEVHFRVSSPPYRWPCFYGLDTGKRSDLLAADMSVGEIKEYLGVDSLAYLDLDRLLVATGAPANGFCTACFSGEYPVAVPEFDTKFVLESNARVDARGTALDNGFGIDLGAGLGAGLGGGLGKGLASEPVAVQLIVDPSTR